MSYIAWIGTKQKPRVIAIFDKIFASTGVINHHSPMEFEQIVGRENAKAALDRYYRQQAKAEVKEEAGKSGRRRRPARAA